VTEWNAAEYHRLSNPQMDWGTRLLEQLPARETDTVLDAGCGSGRLTVELAARIPRGRLIALDLSHNMTAKAREELAGAAIPVLVANANLTALPLAHAVDGIFSNAVFHWIKNHDRLFAEIFRALKPGGWLLAQCGGGPNLERTRARARRLVSHADFLPHFKGWQEPWLYATPSETADRLRRTGFEGVEAWLHAAPTIFESADTYRDFLASVIMHPYLAQIKSAVLRDRLLDEMTAAAAHDTPPFTLDYWRLTMRAHRPK
jgi:trans-aconitate 2-methyltransferase